MNRGSPYRRLSILLSSFLLFLSPSLIPAVTNTEVFSNLSYDLRFAPARGVGMGKAFIALADDPSTAFINPGGLLQIEEQTLLFEGRFLDREFNLRSTGTEFSSDYFAFSTLAWTLPLGEKWRVGAFYFETFRDEKKFSSPPLGGLQSIDGSSNLTLRHIGAALSYQLLKKWSFGVGVSYSILDIDYSLVRGGTDLWSADDSDETFTVTLGALWKVQPQVQVGFSAIIPPEFEFTSRLEAPATQRTYSWAFDFPLTIGTGLQIEALEDLIVTLDVIWIDWGALTESGVVEAFGDINLDGNPPAADPAQAGSGDSLKGFYSLRDAFQYHLGLEHRLGTKMPVALRGGYYHLDSTGIRFIPEVPPGAPPELVAQPEFFSGSGSEEHITFGVGLGLGEHFNLDLAVDLEANRTEISAGVQIIF